MKNIQLNINAPEHSVIVDYDAGRTVLRVKVDGETVLRILHIPASVQFRVIGRDLADTTELDVHARALSSYPIPPHAALPRHESEPPVAPAQPFDFGPPINPINWDDDETHLPPFEQTASTDETSPSTVEHESAEYVFRDPAEKQAEAWRIFWHGDICTPCFNSKGAAEACLHMYQRGERKPEL